MKWRVEKKSCLVEVGQMCGLWQHIQPKLYHSFWSILAREDFRLHGLPSGIVSDKGPKFISCFWKEFCSMLGISISLTSSFHPQSDGQTERTNQDIKTKLCVLCWSDPSKWSHNLPQSWIESVINSLPSCTTGLSRSMLCMAFSHRYSLSGRGRPCSFCPHCCLEVQTSLEKRYTGHCQNIRVTFQNCQLSSSPLSCLLS